MTQENQPADPTNEKRLEQEAAARLLNSTVKQLVGAAMGEFETTLNALTIAVNAQGVNVQKHSEEFEALDRILKGISNGLLALNKRLDEAPVDTADRSVRRRMNRSISTKGILQYDGTVETHGFSREEFEAEQAWMDQLQDGLQPIYEEFVVGVPKRTIPAVDQLNQPEAPEAIVEEDARAT